MVGTDLSSQARGGSPAPVARIFGWGMLALMVAFLLNNVLTFYLGLPGAGGVFGWETNGAPGPAMYGQAAIYAILPALAVFYVIRTPGTVLREDAARISNANATLIRCAFWLVVLVGLADTVISFLRVEGYLAGIVGDELTVELGRSQFRGQWVHIPVALLGVVIGLFTRGISFIWLALLVVVAELLIVFSRFVFSYEQAFMADLVRFWYAALFLFASAYTLLEDGHVRVDVFYTNFPRRRQGKVNAVGAIILGMTLCWTILLIGMWTKSSIINSPMLVFETTQTGFGMYVKYFMAGFLGIFAVSMLIQFVSSFLDSVADAREEPGGRGDHHTGPAG
jgi:TRAP-type mannitol/chloroaromatic compound transport system permease small subunit